VAERVAREGNPAALIAEIEKGEQIVTLPAITSAILERERGKLGALRFEDSKLPLSLYSADEQLDRLVARVYGLPPPDLPPMSSADAQTYAAALETWVAEHPFLNGGGATSSAVFDAVVSTRALRNDASKEAALRRELSRGGAANPFLSEFYLSGRAAGNHIYLPPEHIGVLYASLRARLSVGDTASLTVEGAEDAEEEEALRADVEIMMARREGDRPLLLNFETDQVGAIRLGVHIEDVDIATPHTRVEIGPGAEAVLVAPISIQCETLTLTTDRLIVEGAPAGAVVGTVYLEAREFAGAQMASVPGLRGKVSLLAFWPGVRSHPWINFATEPTPPVDPRVDEALRRLRKFVISFRSHGKGSLGRYRHKIEHERMIKGSGQAILDALLAHHILSLQGSMYFLDPEALATEVGTTYKDCMSRRFNPRTITFAQRALDDA
jgi:hypothetical protein